MILDIKTAKWEDIKPWWQHNDGFKHNIEPIKEKFMVPIITYDKFVELFHYEKDKVFVAYVNKELVGCCMIHAKRFDRYEIGGLGKVCVSPKYRKNNICSELLKISIQYMVLCDFDVSILWASVLKVYDKFGWVDIYKNMMIKYFKPVEESKQYWIDSIKTIGTW